MTKLSKAIALATAMTAGLAATATTQAEVSASADIASMYLWHGQNLSGGAAVVSGSLDYSHDSGLYAGVWGTSGDATLGTEYDLYVGYAGSAGDFGYDVAYATYIYPGSASDDINDSAEVSLGFSYAGASLSFLKNTDTDANGEYLFTTLGYEMGKFGFTLGNASGTSTDNADSYFSTDYTHVDVSYAYNDNISFTASQIVDQAEEDAAGNPLLDDSTLFVVSYSLPIE
jgi:uncharacterized protein (TIGR02001 family)